MKKVATLFASIVVILSLVDLTQTSQADIMNVSDWPKPQIIRTSVPKKPRVPRKPAQEQRRAFTPPVRTGTLGVPKKTQQGAAVKAVIGGVRSVSSTAYCLRGTMANGKQVHDGAVAMNGEKFGTQFKVLDGPFAGRVLTVSDRIGHGSQFDVWVPSCSWALDTYGRRQIRIQKVVEKS